MLSLSSICSLLSLFASDILAYLFLGQSVVAYLRRQPENYPPLVSHCFHFLFPRDNLLFSHDQSLLRRRDGLYLVAVVERVQEWKLTQGQGQEGGREGIPSSRCSTKLPSGGELMPSVMKRSGRKRDCWIAHYNTLSQVLIGLIRILKQISCNLFSGNSSERTLRSSVLGTKQFRIGD